MAAYYAHLKNEFTEDEKQHNLMRWLKCYITATVTLQVKGSLTGERTTFTNVRIFGEITRKKNFSLTCECLKIIVAIIMIEHTLIRIHSIMGKYFNFKLHLLLG